MMITNNPINIVASVGLALGAVRCGKRRGSARSASGVVGDRFGRLGYGNGVARPEVFQEGA
jgi:hypothetical protein